MLAFYVRSVLVMDVMLVAGVVRCDLSWCGWEGVVVVCGVVCMGGVAVVSLPVLTCAV